MKLYAALLARELAVAEKPAEQWLLRLLYCHPDTLAVIPFEQRVMVEDLQEFLTRTLAWYAAWWVDQKRHLSNRDHHGDKLVFPYERYRPHQQAMARRAYQALRSGEHLLLEAPTGSGKTMALLYPAIKSLTGEGIQKILFLTSKTTGAAAARDACRDIDPDGSFLRTVALTAKEKTCLVAGMPCDPDRCTYANGYFDRIHQAVSDLLTLGNVGAEEIEDMARKHRVCPFELSLDAAVWADIVIADYNYVFDPVVRLQRFAGRSDIALLIDESHQLAPRAREMLSLTLQRSMVKSVLTEALPDLLLRRVRSIDRQLLAFRREQGVTTEAVVPRPEALLRALGRFVEGLIASEVSLEQYPRTRQLAFDAFRWTRSDVWYDDERFEFILRRTKTELTLQLFCLDPAPYLKEVLEGFGGHVRFSGTISPLDLYQDLHGLPEGPAERVGSPFSSRQLGVYIIDDVPTYWRQREQSLNALVHLVVDVVTAKPGKYLVALPSYQYLRQFSEAFETAEPVHELLVQEPAMSDEQRLRFLAHFADSASPVLGVVVLGGVFTESVDFRNSKLSGVICVGLGLPPPSLERGLIEKH
ncbi:MAG: DEAD/DEAH box helicase, partial [Gammaproteobacteria bacterium]|nr:DEAD/DEAH box helicase [Gammaproteobacteria bacterium]